MLKRLLLISLLGVVGCGAPSLLITPVQRNDGLEEIMVERGSGSRKIAIIPVDGIIANARTPGLIEPGDNKLSILSQQLDRAAQDSAVKAVVLRINSPGGTVTGSDNFYELVSRFRQKTGKPVVASIQEVGASGGYYVALSADQIVACPTSVVGSIGVIFNAFSVEGTMNMLGVKSEVVKSGAMKDMASPFKAITKEERELMQQQVDEYFARFKSLVVTKRALTDSAQIALATDGRVFSGEQARQLGLVDRCGILDDAVELARELADARGGRAVMYRKPFGPGGSVYANTSTPQPQMSLIHVLPESELTIPTGFYYLWRP
jgi:protease IV